MNRDLLLEIGCEEIPARYVAEILTALETSTKKHLDDLKLSHGTISVFSTPRRMVVAIKDLAESQQSISVKVKGPAVKVAFDEHHQPTKALLGFLQKNGKTPADVTIETINGTEQYTYLITSSVAEQTVKLLPNMLKDIVVSLPLPRSMKWNVFSFKFIRPIRWILALYGTEVVPFAVEDIVSSNITFGHRTLANKSAIVKNSDEYLDVLKKLQVLPTFEERKALILKQIANLEKKHDIQIAVENGLLAEVTNLVEYPTADVGNFDKSFLKLPDEVLITPMRDHQRYFPVYKDGKLTNQFVYVRNGDDKHIETVRHGNEKVLVARLSDAKFFFEEDLKHNLKERAEKLNQIVFRDGLGTMADKAQRIGKLGLFLAQQTNCGCSLTNLETASRLCKADLMTNLVNEFEELQGVMGMHYAKREGYDSAICLAIGSHYKPRFAEDSIPADELGAILSVADKLDSIMSSFAIGVVPSGSQDPFGLRRQCLGVINVILGKNWNLDLDQLLSAVKGEYVNFTKNVDELFKSVREFFIGRLKSMFESEGKTYDQIDAVLNSTHPLMLRDLKNKFEALKHASEIQLLNENQTRVKNLLAKNIFGDKILIKTFTTKEEKALYDAIVKFEKTNFASYEAEIKAYHDMNLAITNLFANVLIMDKDEKIKYNRLTLLNEYLTATTKIADFSLLKI